MRIGSVRPISPWKVLNMADRWYYASDKQKLGPYSAMQLKQLAALTRIRPTDMVWKNDIEKGVVAAKVKHLFAGPQIMSTPSEAIADVADEPSSSARLPEVLSALISDEVAHPEKLPTSTNGHGKSVVQLQKIPDEFLLQALPGQIDLASLPTPWTTFPGPETIQNKTPESTTALTAIPDLIGPKSPAIQGSNQPTQSKPARKSRATVVRGAVIVAQDGESVKYRKKCIKCGNEDSCTRTMPIKTGIVRVSYYCPKCRRNGEVVIQSHII
jgi:hypothetical protein